MRILKMVDELLISGTGTGFKRAGWESALSHVCVEASVSRRSSTECQWVKKDLGPLSLTHGCS